jgi:small-conductance mechanosensitive channel
MAPTVQQILSIELWQNTVADYLFAILIFTVVLLILRIFKFVILKKLKKMTTRSKVEWDDLLIGIIHKLGWPFYILVALYISIIYIDVHPLLQKFLDYLLIISATYYATKGVIAIVHYARDKVIDKKLKEDKDQDTTIIKVLAVIVQIIVWVLAIILVIQNFGYDVTALVAGVGIGGIAIAFALQNVLSDIFASFSIYFDKPFQTGDFIIIGDDLGVVKEIGIKSTRITSLQGEEIVISNKELTSTRIHNYKKMRKRRIAFTFGVTYGTRTKKLEKIPDIVKKIINKIDKAEVDRVHFKEFADFSLNFEVVYYVDSSDYNVHMGIRQKINLGIKKAFEKAKIEMAFPTQTIFLKKDK